MGKIAVIYTGGTLGMGYQGEKLAPMPFAALKEYLPLLRNWQRSSCPPLYNLQPFIEKAEFNPAFPGNDRYSFFDNQTDPKFVQSWQNFQTTPFEKAKLRLEALELDIYAWQQPLDSSSLAFTDWQTLAATIQSLARLEEYQGFLVLHGTDTLSYTASALSFALLHLKQPVVVTGASQPFIFQGSDALWNFYFSLVFLRLDLKGVWLCFDRSVLPGPASSKTGSEEDFFIAPKQERGVLVKNRQASWLVQPANKKQVPDSSLFGAGVLPVYFNPSLRPSDLEAIFSLPIDCFLLLGYGSGNLPENPAFRRAILGALEQQKKLVLVSQSLHATTQSKYQAGGLNIDRRMIDGQDLTFEAALTKISWLSGLPADLFTALWETNLAGEGSFG